MKVLREPMTARQRRWARVTPTDGDDLAMVLTFGNIVLTGGLIGGGLPALLVGHMYLFGGILLTLAGLLVALSIKLLVTWHTCLVHVNSYGDFYGRSSSLSGYSNDLRDLSEFEPELAREFADKIWLRVEQDNRDEASSVAKKVTQLLAAYRRRQRAQQKMSGAASTYSVEDRVKMLDEQTADLEKIVGDVEK